MKTGIGGRAVRLGVICLVALLLVVLSFYGAYNGFIHSQIFDPQIYLLNKAEKGIGIGFVANARNGSFEICDALRVACMPVNGNATQGAYAKAWLVSENGSLFAERVEEEPGGKGISGMLEGVVLNPLGALLVGYLIFCEWKLDLNKFMLRDKHA